MRPYPNLIHPVAVTLEQIDRPATVYDENTRAPIQQAARKAAVTLSGQASYGSAAGLMRKTYGLIKDESGYVTFSRRDLVSRSITLSIGDRITLIGNESHDAYIVRLQPMGHYPEYGNTLVRAYYQDRKPAKQRATDIF